MDSDRAFLRAIADSPDPSLRLVYADWLEEHGDLRAELVRIEEESRTVPVYSDRYWKLQPRRRELLESGAPRPWLKTMGYDSPSPIFAHGVPDGYKERWRLIRAFVERWHGLSLGDVGGRKNEVRATEKRLGRTLPPSLREWVAFAFDFRKNPDDTCVFRDGYRMTELAGHPAVSLLLQCEGDYHYAVRHQDFELDDPPVYGFLFDYDNDAPEAAENKFIMDRNHPLTPTLTEFVLQYGMSCTRGKGGGFGTEVAKPAKLRRDLIAAFDVRAQFGNMELFESDNLLIRLGRSIWTQSDSINVEMLKPAPTKTIPEFLWDYTRRGGSFHGAFAKALGLK